MKQKFFIQLTITTDTKNPGDSLSESFIKRASKRALRELGDITFCEAFEGKIHDEGRLAKDGGPDTEKLN